MPTTTTPNTITIKWTYPIGRLIKENGLQFCLEYLPTETRNYLTHIATYGKEVNNHA